MDLKARILKALRSILVALGLLDAPAPFMPPQPTALRKDLKFWYYFTGADQAAATADHVNLVHEQNEFGPLSLIASMRAHGKPTVLALDQVLYTPRDNCTPRPDFDERLMALFTAMRSAGVLPQVVALYPMDEPDGHHISDATATAMNEAVRAIAGRFSELAGVKIATCFTIHGDFPGFASNDWVSVDAYDEGPEILASRVWLDLMARLSPTQQAFLTVGGGNPWRADPEPYRRYAHSTPQVMGIMAFMWAERPMTGEVGIGRNGLAEAYQAVGREFIGTIKDAS
jgi:hypothetical protein